MTRKVLNEFLLQKLSDNLVMIREKNNLPETKVYFEPILIENKIWRSN